MPTRYEAAGGTNEKGIACLLKRDLLRKNEERRPLRHAVTGSHILGPNTTFWTLLRAKSDWRRRQSCRGPMSHRQASGGTHSIM